MTPGPAIGTFCGVGTLAIAACVFAPTLYAILTLLVCVTGIVAAGRS